MVEEYRTIPGFPNYEVSNLGKIWNTKTGYVLKGYKYKDGYIGVALCIDGVLFRKLIHVLVAKTFLENPKNKPCVDHINGDTSDNRLANLRYATIIENGRNRKMSSRNTSGIKGVSFDKKSGRWHARIQIDGIRVHLGLFKTKEEAQNARIAKVNEVFGEFTHASERI